jgi:hypothetical protein
MNTKLVTSIHCCGGVFFALLTLPPNVGYANLDRKDDEWQDMHERSNGLKVQVECDTDQSTERTSEEKRDQESSIAGHNDENNLAEYLQKHLELR